jgi:DNA-binding CsgD family transcriptional regulator
VIEGPAGIGKTALLDRTCDLAAEAGLLALRARGGELERAFPHGVVRQLFEGELRAASEDERAALLAGAAELAAPIVTPGSASVAAERAVSDAFAVTHGLYWLTANLAEQTPLVVAVDDAQWADVASLRFLAHLARRIEGMELLLAVCIRTGEPEEIDVSLSQLISEPVTDVLRPAPLSVAAVAQIVAERLGEEPDSEFASACHRATGGTPFLVGELISALAAQGIRPGIDAVAHVGEIGPRTVARAVLQRLERASEAAAKLARAVAVLGADAQLHRAAQLAGIDRDSAVEAADALTTMDILAADRPLEFVHPIVRGAIYEDLRPAARAAAHAKAADVLATEGAEHDAIATHFLLTEPERRPDTVQALRSAAEQAMGRGAPESAVAYLKRALDEGGFEAEERAELLLELGMAERLAQPNAAVDHFREARGLVDNPVQRARIAYELADTLVFIRPSWDEAAGLIEASIEDVEDEDRELAVSLESLRAAGEFYDARLLPGFFERLPKLRKLAGGDSPARRAVALQVANFVAWLGEPREEVHRLLDLGLSGGHSPAEESPESLLVNAAVQSFALTEDLERALEVADEALDICRLRGSLIGMGIASSSRGWVHARRGDLVSAEADTRVVLKLLEEVPFETGMAGALFHAIDPLIERTELEDEARRIREIDFEVDPHSLFWPLGLEARGRVRLAFGDVEGGIDDLNGVEQTLYAHNNPNGWGWRPALALAVASQDRDRAFELLGVYLDRAREIGLPRAIGIGLRTLGLVEGGEEGLAHVEEAVSVLEPSPARLEYARALIELGAAHRRANQRAAAREPLREGLDLAHRCGATRLAERARSELAATGARPRREMLTGRDALTATEQRIAGMAAEGMSNPEIAQAQFVTRKTVENHLGRIYSKLAINSRTQLADALASGDS